MESGSELRLEDIPSRAELESAVRMKKPLVVRELCEKGANVDVVDSGGVPLIGRAAEKANPEIVEILLLHGASTNATDADQNSPLLRYLLQGPSYRWPRWDVVKILLLYNANVNQRNVRGENALDCVIERCRASVMRRRSLLMQDDRVLDPVQPLGEETKILVGLLVRHGIDVNLPSRNGQTPLCRAIENRTPLLVSALLRSGAQAAKMDGEVVAEAEHPIALAARTGQIGVMRDLLAHGASLEEISSDGMTVFERAVKRRTDTVVTFCIGISHLPTAMLDDRMHRMYFERLLHDQPITRWKLGLEGLPILYMNMLRPWILLRSERAISLPSDVLPGEVGDLPIELFANLPSVLASKVIGFITGQQFRFHDP